MKHKVSELKGALLDAAVAKALGSDGGPVWWPDFDTGPMADQFMGDPFKPSTRWDHGGPIKNREKIATWWTGERWAACHPKNTGLGGFYPCSESPIGTAIDMSIGDGMEGEDELQAAMRAYVASKFGEEVELS